MQLDNHTQVDLIYHSVFENVGSELKIELGVLSYIGYLRNLCDWTIT